MGKRWKSDQDVDQIKRSRLVHGSAWTMSQVKYILRSIIACLSVLCVASFTSRLTPGAPNHKSFTHSYHPLGASSSNADLTDWVVESLEDDGDSITRSDPIKAGEGDGDLLPVEGLQISKMRIFAAAQQEQQQSNKDDGDYYPIYLLLGRNGWGTGVHPTTRLCLEWMCDTINDGDVLLDYGCGSGILSITALHMGASRCIGVDVEAEALVTAERNLQLNGWDADGRFQGMHTREVLPYDICPPHGVDVCVANILIGQLVRPSMVAAIVTNLQEGGMLCLSGIRPAEVNALKEAYNDSIEWLDDQYAELSADDTANCIESYGFNVGNWARLVGRKKAGKDGTSFIEQMSDLAVS